MSVFPLTVEVDDTYISILSNGDVVQRIRKRNVARIQALEKDEYIYSDFITQATVTGPTITQDNYPDRDAMFPAVLVSGAGTASVNGIYVPGPDVLGFSAYYKDPSVPWPGGETIYQVAIGAWAIRADGDVQYFHIDNHDYPWLVDSWTQNAGALPIPTVTQATAEDVAAEGISTSQILATREKQYVVRLSMRNGRWFDIPMGLVSNQGTWVNTDAGASTAIEDLTSTTPAFDATFNVPGDASGGFILVNVDDGATHYTLEDSAGNKEIIAGGGIPDMLTLLGERKMYPSDASGNEIGVIIDIFLLFMPFEPLNMGNMPALKSIVINSAGMTGTPVLTASSGLSAIDYSDNLITTPPDLSLHPGLDTLSASGSIGTPTLQDAPDITQSPNLLSINLNSQDLTELAVNQILRDTDFNSLVGGFLDVSGGTSAAPTGAGLTAKANLIVKGWTVNTN